MEKKPKFDFKEGDKLVYFKPYGFPMIKDPNKGKLILNEEYTLIVSKNSMLDKDEYYLIDKNGVKLSNPYNLVELICFFKNITNE
jgi:hypothetical protein